MNKIADPAAFSAAAGSKHHHPSLVLLALSIGGFAIGTTEFAAMSLVPYFAPDLGIGVTTAGHVISAYALGVVVGAPIIAVLAARMARRTLLVVLMLLFALGNGLSALAPTYGFLVGFRFIAGLPHGAYFGVAALVAASLVPRERRSQAVSRVLAGAHGRDHGRRALGQSDRPVCRLALQLRLRRAARLADGHPGAAVRALWRSAERREPTARTRRAQARPGVADAGARARSASAACSRSTPIWPRPCWR